MSNAPRNDVIADLTASVSRTLGMTTPEDYTRIEAAVSEAVSDWDVTRETDCFRDANGRLRDPNYLNEGSPGPDESCVWQQRLVIHFPWKDRSTD